MAETGAGIFFSHSSRYQSAGGPLIFASLVLVDFVTNQEFAEPGIDVAIHRDGNAIGIEPDLFDRVRTFQRFAAFFIQAEIDPKNQEPGRSSFVSVGFVFEEGRAFQAAAERVGGIEEVERLGGIERFQSPEIGFGRVGIGDLGPGGFARLADLVGGPAQF